MYMSLVHRFCHRIIKEEKNRKANNRSSCVVCCVCVFLLCEREEVSWSVPR